MTCCVVWPSHCRSSAVSCLAVTTITGMSRHSGFTRSRSRKRKSVHLRHQQIEQDQPRRRIRLEPGDGLASVRCQDRAKAEFLDGPFGQLAGFGFIFHHQHRAMRTARAATADHFEQFLAIHRLAEERNGAEFESQAAILIDGDQHDGNRR